MVCELEVTRTGRADVAHALPSAGQPSTCAIAVLHRYLRRRRRADSVVDGESGVTGEAGGVDTPPMAAPTPSRRGKKTPAPVAPSPAAATATKRARRGASAGTRYASSEGAGEGEGEGEGVGAWVVVGPST
jgi:hypothetical protein